LIIVDHSPITPKSLKTESKPFIAAKFKAASGAGELSEVVDPHPESCEEVENAAEVKFVIAAAGETAFVPPLAIDTGVDKGGVRI